VIADLLSSPVPTVPLKPLYWIASSLKDLKAMPVPLQKAFGTALRSVQLGGMPRTAKPLRGFGGAGVLELAEDYDRGTYRAVYTVNLPGVVYVLHVFQKKSRRGIATPRQDMDLVRHRYQLAQNHYRSIEQKREDRHG
jgi:phage-related protein